MDFKDYDDNELVLMAKEESLEAKDMLFEKYKYVIDIVVNKYANMVKILGIDFTDLYQDAFIGFTDAINSFDPHKESTIKTFISVCVERKIQTSLKKASRIKNKILSESLSLEHIYENVDNPLLCLLGDDNKNNPLNNILENENVEELVKKIKETLSDAEYEVYSLLVSGLNYQEIATILDCEPKKIDNTIQRIRHKVKKIIE